MNESSIILQNVSEDRLRQIISEVVKEQIDKKNPVPEKFLSRFEVKNRLGISYPTLDKALATGELKGYRIRGRILIKESDLSSLSEKHTR